MTTPEYYMRRALTISEQALAQVRSNPMVGAVIVKNGNIIAEGFHEKFGEAHAEVNALKNLSLEESTGADLYVTLEPCCHYGKTPPCTQAIIKAGINKVVYGMRDPNPQVAGKGFEELRQAGILVEGPVLERECLFLNRRFITLQEKQRPWIILKWAQSKDGNIAPLPRAQVKISSEESHQLVQKYRSEEMSIMVGTTTCLVDNPRLTCRIAGSHQPLRITIDRHEILPATLAIFLDQPTLLFSVASKISYPQIVSVVELKKPQSPLPEIVERLGKMQILSLIVEGGATFITEFISAGLWDEARVFTSAEDLTDGLAAPVLPQTASHTEQIGPDILSIFFKDLRIVPTPLYEMEP